MNTFDPIVYYDLFGEEEQLEQSQAKEKTFKYNDMCADCLGTGEYIGFRTKSACTECSGKGWVPLGTGISLAEALRRGIAPWQKR